MLEIYKCVESYGDIQVGTYWVARTNHFVFQKIEYPSGIEKVYKHISPYELKKYFIKLKES